jgi:hypothetical protein
MLKKHFTVGLYALHGSLLQSLTHLPAVSN